MIAIKFSGSYHRTVMSLLLMPFSACLQSTDQSDIDSLIAKREETLLQVNVYIDIKGQHWDIQIHSHNVL